MLTAEKYITEHWIPNRTWTHLSWPKHQVRFEDIIRYLKGLEYCDVGCACGHSTVIMDRLNCNLGKWTGIDFSSTGINKAIELFPNYKWEYVKSFSGIVNTGKYDFIVCSEVIEHVKNPLELVNGLLAALNQDGRLVITTPSKRVTDPGHLKIFQSEDFETLLEGKRYTLKLYQNAFWYVIIDKENENGHI